MITKLDTATAVIESLPDPPENPDMQQTEHLVQAHSTLGAHFGKRDDVLVSGEGYLLVSADSVEDWGQHFYPDCIVAFGVDPKAIADRNGYVIAEVGKPPDFVLEIASPSTASRDETVKRSGYEAMGVLEFWRFDGSGKGFYVRPLSGDRLVGNVYVPIELEEVDGETRGYSQALSLYLCVDAESRLRFWDPVTQEYLPTHLEAVDRAAEMARRAAEMADRAAEMAAARDRERAARMEAEAEVARLRSMLGRS